MYRPYGGGEMNMFNFAYNLITLQFKKANQQLPNDELRRTLKYMNIGKWFFLLFLTTSEVRQQVYKIFKF